jgi:hypothetical protein
MGMRRLQNSQRMRAQVSKGTLLNGLPDTLKDFLIPLPIFGTIAAVVFDVGYFYGIDINLFTLFTLSEHILFSIEALPFVFVAISIFGSVFLGKAFGKSLERDLLSRFELPKVAWRARLPSYPHLRVAVLLAGCVMLAGLLAWVIFFPPTTRIPIAIFAVFLVLTIALIAPQTLASRRVQLVGGVLGCILARFFWAGSSRNHMLLKGGARTKSKRRQKILMVRLLEVGREACCLSRLQ